MAQPHDSGPVTVDEKYEVASNTSDLTVGGGMIPPDVRTAQGDVILAAGMNESRLGMALLRLHSEWQSAAKPRRIDAAAVERLAESFRQQDEADRANCERENGELHRLEQRLAAADPSERFDLMVAIMERKRLYESGALPKRHKPKGGAEERARIEAEHWYANELRILANRLKGRALVLEQLMQWGQIKGVPAETVSRALLHWLAPTCQRCDGLGLIYRTNLPVKPCDCSHGETWTTDGEEYVIGHIKYCLGTARRSLRKRLER